MVPEVHRADTKRRRHRQLIIAGLGLVVIAFVGIEVLIQRAASTPAPISNSVLLHGITVLNIILLVVLLLVLGRNLVKLYLDRRREKLGSKFRTKLVATYIGLAMIPSTILFLVASDFIQKSIDRWFSTSVQEVAVRSRELVRVSLVEQERQLLTLSNGISQKITTDRLLTRDAWQLLRRRMVEQLVPLQLHAINVYELDQPLIDPVIDSESPLNGRDTTLHLPAAQIALALHGQPFTLQEELDDAHLMLRAGVPVMAPNGRDVAGLLVATRVVNNDLTEQVHAIETLYQSYVQGNDRKEPIKTAYLLTFLLITLLTLFGAVWVGLYLARGVTVPIQMLAEGTRAVASGDLSYQVSARANDELGTLVDSFNQMTRDLLAGQKNLENSRQHLELTVTELEERRSYMEAVLANITTGVVSMNAAGLVTTFNRAACSMLGIEAANAIGRPYDEVFAGPNIAQLREFMQRARPRHSELEQQLTVESDGQRLTIAAHCSSLRDSAEHDLGVVVVLDDLTELVRGQKASAWREVARRIAHEIRNPLTPIQLSAQRIARRYRRAAGAEGEDDMIEEGTRTILQEVSTLKGLVDEFSRFARMPSTQPVPTDLERLLADSLLPYETMHDGVRVARGFDGNLPQLNLDPGQMRRVFTNLFDNAVAAMKKRGTLSVSTALDPDLAVARIEVGDSGPGIRTQDRDRLFLPYFSRKRDGTGLGLAIVHQIISDHRGYVRLVDNHPRGARFIIELPV